ncbi:MAG: DNA polymerase III subunit gamma/tau [Brevefilum sp.]
MTQALYRKWRPQGWDEVVAQEHVVQTLQNAVANDRVAHAFLFAGPRGTGKTTTARLLAKAVNCLDSDLGKRPCNTCDHCQALNTGRFLDLIEIDAASNTSVDDVRDLREKINFSPSQGRFKVYIIDEVHMLSNAAFNALLKTLEEPPPHAIFVLATTEIHKIPATVLSRCQRHEFRRIPIASMVTYLKAQSQLEGIDVDGPVFTEIARQATGSLRDAVSLLDQLTSSSEHITLEMAQKILGTATSLRVIEVIDALLQKDAPVGLTVINNALDSGTDARQFARQIVTYLRNVLLYKMGNQAQVEANETIKETLEKHAEQFAMRDLLSAIESFNQATNQEQANWHPGLGLELAFTNFLAEPTPTPMTVHLSPEPVETVASVKQPPKPEPIKAQQVSIDKPKQAPKSDAPDKQKQTEKTPPESQQDEAHKDQPEPVERKPVTTKALKQAAVAPPEGELSLTFVQQSWGKIKAMVKQHNASTEGLLNSSKLVGIKANKLILGFSSSILKEMMEKKGHINLTLDILEEVLGRPVLIECIVTTHEGSTIPEDLQIDQDGMVSTATRDLGGRISRAKEEKRDD